MYNKETLNSGLRVITEEIPYLRSASLGVWVASGSRYEAGGEEGISHFLEHLLFKGTKRRSAKEIAEAVDSVGGQLNAFTGKEYTCFYVKVLDEHLDLGLDILADMYHSSLLEPGDIEKEKGVVLEEIKLYEDTPDELVHDLFARAIWGGHALGRSILGTAESVTSLNQEKIRAYYGDHFTPGNTVVAAAGHFKHPELVQMVEKVFRPLTGTAKTEHPVGPGEENRILVRSKDTEQVHLCLGTIGLPHDHPDTYGLHILNAVLGGGPSSRLFQEIREERGLAYSVYSYQNSYRDTGAVGIYAGMSPKYVGEVIKIVVNELAALAQTALPDAELTRAKEQLKGNLMLSLESSSSRMSQLGRSEVAREKVWTSDEMVAEIERVTAEQVQRLAATFNLQGKAMALVGMVPEGLDLEGLLNGA